MTSANPPLSYLIHEETESRWEFWPDGLLIELPQPRRRRMIAETTTQIIAYTFLSAALLAIAAWRQIRRQIWWGKQIVFILGAILFGIQLLVSRWPRQQVGIE